MAENTSTFTGAAADGTAALVAGCGSGGGAGTVGCGALLGRGRTGTAVGDYGGGTVGSSGKGDVDVALGAIVGHLIPVADLAADRNDDTVGDLPQTVG